MQYVNGHEQASPHHVQLGDSYLKETKTRIIMSLSFRWDKKK